MVLLFCIVASGTVTNFFPTVVATLGYNNVQSLLLTSPPYVLAVICTYLNATHADRTGERYFHITIPLWVSVVAYIIAATTTTTAPRYVSMMLMVGASPFRTHSNPSLSKELMEHLAHLRLLRLRRRPRLDQQHAPAAAG